MPFNPTLELRVLSTLTLYSSALLSSCVMPAVLTCYRNRHEHGAVSLLRHLSTHCDCVAETSNRLGGQATRCC